MANDAVRTLDLIAQPTAAIRVTKAAAELSVAFGELLPVVGTAVGQRGGSFSGPPFLRYHSMDSDTFDVEIGMPLHGAIAGLPAIESVERGQVGASELPGGRAVMWLYTGPYAELGWGWDEFNAWMASNGHKGTVAWESYIDNPDMVPPDNLRTELYWSLASS